MNKKELVRRVACLLRDRNIRKTVRTKKHTFHISDDEGHSKDFVIKQSDKDVLYTAEDIEAIVDGCAQVIVDAIKSGESVSVRGIGTLGLKYRVARATKIPGTEDWVDVAGRYTPKFTSGDLLRHAAKMYEMNLSDAQYKDEDIVTETDDDEDGEP